MTDSKFEIAAQAAWEKSVVCKGMKKSGSNTLGVKELWKDGWKDGWVKGSVVGVKAGNPKP